MCTLYTVRSNFYELIVATRTSHCVMIILPVTKAFLPSYIYCILYWIEYSKYFKINLHHLPLKKLQTSGNTIFFMLYSIYFLNEEKIYSTLLVSFWMNNILETSWSLNFIPYFAIIIIIYIITFLLLFSSFHSLSFFTFLL